MDYYGTLRSVEKEIMKGINIDCYLKHNKIICACPDIHLVKLKAFRAMFCFFLHLHPLYTAFLTIAYIRNAHVLPQRNVAASYSCWS